MRNICTIIIFNLCMKGKFLAVNLIWFANVAGVAALRFAFEAGNS